MKFSPCELARRTVGILLTLLMLLAAASVNGFAADVEIPLADTNAPIVITARHAAHWPQGAYEVWVLRGETELRQGEVVAKGAEAVLWVDRAEAFSGRASKVIAYLEGPNGGVQVDFGAAGDPHAFTGRTSRSLVDSNWIGRFQTTAGIQLQTPPPAAEPNVKPAVFQRGLEAWSKPLAMQTSLLQEEIAPPIGQPVAPRRADNATVLGGARRVRFSARNGGRSSFSTTVDEERGERVTLATSGWQVVIEGLDELGAVTMETDRFVLWTPKGNPSGGNLSNLMNSDDGPLELYLEGNIIFRQGDRVIYADRMYYNVRSESGVVFDAELLTPIKDYQGLLRLRADVLQQLNRQQFQAYNAALTSSRIGVPRYWFQTGSASLTDVQTPLVDPFTGQVVVDPQTGQPEVEHNLLATSQNNFIYLLGAPVFYWPVIATNLSKPTYYIDSISVKSDRIFGQQLLVDFDLFQLLGIQNAPKQNKWTLSTDLLTERGLALGTYYSYQGDNFLGAPGPYAGFIDAWGLKDDGVDNLGRDRRSLVPEADFRGRVLARHRQEFPGGFQLTGEVGLISDRNFLEQYYEQEWDTFKDQATGLELKRLDDNTSLSISADLRVNDFFTQTEWLPRADHYWLGQSLLFDRLTWFEHSNIGYANLQIATTPTNPTDAAKFDPLAWEVPSEGLRAVTRHELDLPLEAGPVKVTPYLLGEAGYWQNDLNGDEATRLYGQAGIRAALPMWTADPTIRSELLNLNGIAHKITYEVEAFYADSSIDFDQLPLYDQIDDDSTEHFRRRMLFDTYGLTFGQNAPLRFDERYFALRSAQQSNVTSPVSEIADDLMEVRLGVKNRWQTKRGLPGQERIVDWVSLDVDAVIFPDGDRDNFGEEIGLIDYDFRWHIGDRLTILSDGFADVFSQGLRQVTLGGVLNRPEAGSLYLGIRSTEGPISSNVLAGSLSYRLSEKWIATGGASIDLAQTGNIGQNIAFTRIGESFFLKFGVNYDASRDNVGFSFGIEPRFLPRSRLGRVGGVQVPPAGAMGLE